MLSSRTGKAWSKQNGQRYGYDITPGRAVRNAEGQITARDQNKVFVECADRSPLSVRQTEAQYLLKCGKGNAYIEFDALPDEVYAQANHLTGATEFFLRGDVVLSMRNPQGFDNS